MNYILNNELVVYSFCTITICLLTGYLLKSYVNPRVIETPSSPQTFNLTLEQFKETQEILERGEELDFIKSGNNCFPDKYPMISADEPISEYSNFDLDFLAKDFTGNLIEKMEELTINCSFENYELFDIVNTNTGLYLFIFSIKFLKFLL